MFLKILKCIIVWSLFVHRKGGIRWIEVYHLYLGLVALNPHQCLSPLEKEDLTVYLFYLEVASIHNARWIHFCQCQKS